MQGNDYRLQRGMLFWMWAEQDVIYTQINLLVWSLCGYGSYCWLLCQCLSPDSVWQPCSCGAVYSFHMFLLLDFMLWLQLLQSSPKSSMRPRHEFAFTPFTPETNIYLFACIEWKWTGGQYLPNLALHICDCTPGVHTNKLLKLNNLASFAAFTLTHTTQCCLVCDFR